MDILSTNLANIFHRYLIVENKQLSSDKNFVRKARININKYGHLFNPICSQQINNNLQINDNKLKKKNKQIKEKKKKKKKIKKMKKTNNRKRKEKTEIKSKKKNIQPETHRHPPKLIFTSPSTPNSVNQVKVQSSRDPIQSLTTKTEDHQSSEISHVSSSTPSITSAIDRTETPTFEQDNHSIDSTSHNSYQCREKIERLYNMDPIINKNYSNTRYLSNEMNSINTIQHRKMKQYSKGLKAEQLFRCPKDSRSKRRKCCGVYYELFDDVWRTLQGWFTME